jgi:hypothetical protein
MADIFLSYARENSEIAKRLSERLESIGWSVWWDWEIPAGQTWRDTIEQSLASMRCMVVLWSMDSIDSDWVKEEAERGNAQRALVAAVIDEVEPPMGFSAIQAANLIGWDGSQDLPGFCRLIDDLETHLGKPVKNRDAEPATVSAQGHIMEISYAVRQRFLRLPEGSLGAGLARFTDCDAFLDFTLFTRTVTGFLDAAGLASASAIAACAAANRAMATRNGEQLT